MVWNWRNPYSSINSFSGFFPGIFKYPIWNTGNSQRIYNGSSNAWSQSYKDKYNGYFPLGISFDYYRIETRSWSILGVSRFGRTYGNKLGNRSCYDGF